MDTLVNCPYCGSFNTKKTTNGNLSNGLATVGAIVGGTLLQAVTGIPGIFGANVAYGQTWHQYCCLDCHEVFKVKLGASGNVKEVKKY